MTRVPIASMSILLILASMALAATGQEPHPPTSLEIPLLERDAAGAKWTAMGGASIGAVDDGSAIITNPAGLARIRRIEILGTIHKQSYDVDATWFGSDTQRSLSSTTLRELTFSFPFPTYRGSLVLSGSMNRRNVFDNYTVRAGIYPSGDIPYRDSEERSGALTCWSAGVATQVSPQAFVGIEGHGFTGDIKEIDKWGRWGICEDVEFSWDADLGGYGASMGMQYQPLPIFGIGAVVRTPQRITLKGDGDQPVWDDAASDCVNQQYSIDDSATLPYSMGVGVSLEPGRFLINLDMIYTDWHELKYLGRVRDPNTGDYLYEPTTDLRAGIEYALGLFPLRLRAGYARIPLEFQWFNVTKDRSSFSLGAGTVVESALAFDFAWERTSFERESRGDLYSETRTIDRLILTLAYRF